MPLASGPLVAAGPKDTRGLSHSTAFPVYLGTPLNEIVYPQPPMSRRLLIADDSETVRWVLRRYLSTRSDVEICAEARNGREAVEAALALKPDLMILDVIMPEMNGIEVSTVLKESLPETKTILFTMYGDSIGKNLAAAAGVNVILEKADGLSKLVHILDCFLRAGEQHA